MLTTHVGSLPFTSINEAIEFTFKFDIPVLFTLPMLNPKEFMHLELIDKLKVGEFTDDKIVFNNLINTDHTITSNYEKEFFEHLEVLSVKRFKFQQTGPITLYELSDKSVDLEKIIESILPKFLELLERLSKRGNLIFIIDEPMLYLHFDKHIASLNKLLRDLNTIKGIDVGIHTCSKLTPSQLNLIDCKYINLDSSLYLASELALINNKLFVGIKCTEAMDIETATKSTEYLNKTEILSPSCGLAFESIKTISSNIDNLYLIQKIALVSSLN
jgi:methionine synthase II (cobalamin-independent)